MSAIKIIAAKGKGRHALASARFARPALAGDFALMANSPFASPKQSDSFAFDRAGLPATGRYHTYY